jgi:hypothetical protein
MIEIVGNNELERHMWLESLLREGVYEVTFTKVDGSIRTMPCTLKPDLLPERVISETSGRVVTKPLKIETMSAWATDIKEWRSFRVMNVTEVKPL